MRKPRVSVIIPTYNRCDLLRGAVQSVFAQSFSDFEIIVVDDGSTDGTAELCRAFGDRIRYLKQSNRGVAAARNAGVRAAVGEFICFLDSDDLWEPEKLARQLAFADQNPQYGLISTEISVFDENGTVRGKSKASSYRIVNGNVAEQLLFANWIQTSTVLVRAEVLHQIGGFDEDVGQFGEDWLLWMRIASRHPVYFLPEALVRYRSHPQSLTSEKPEQQYQNLMLILDRLRSIAPFSTRPGLIATAAYRISLGRAQSDLQAKQLVLAMKKLKYARSLKRIPLRAIGLQLRVSMASFRLKTHAR